VRRERERLSRHQMSAAERDRRDVAKALPGLLASLKQKPLVIAADRQTGPWVLPWDQLVEEVTAEMIAQDEREKLRVELAADRDENAAVLAQYAPNSRVLRAHANSATRPARWRLKWRCGSAGGQRPTRRGGVLSAR